MFWLYITNIKNNQDTFLSQLPTEELYEHLAFLGEAGLFEKDSDVHPDIRLAWGEYDENKEKFCYYNNYDFNCKCKRCAEVNKNLDEQDPH